MSIPREDEAIEKLQVDLEQNRRFLESIVENIPNMVFVKDAKDLRFTLINKAGAEILGLAAKDMIGKSDHDFFPPEQADFFVRKDREVLRDKVLLDIPEEPIATARGTRYLHTRKIPILGPDGEPTYLLGISEDITEQKQISELLDQQRQALAQASKLSLLGEMAGGIAHEINNPLTIIQGYANRLLKRAQARHVDSTSVGETAKSILNTVERIARIIRGLRGYARDGSSDPMQRVPVRALLQETLSFIREKLKSSGLRLTVVDVADEISVFCRPTEISQVLLNLLSNAYDAVLLVTERWIEIGVEQDDAMVTLSVTDSGPGIPEALRGKIGRPFFTTKERGKGTGLGLSISRAILDTHGGELVLDDTSPNTKFLVRLPRGGEGAAGGPPC